MKENKLEKKLERHKKNDFKKKKEKVQQDKYKDLPSHILNKLYR